MRKHSTSLKTKVFVACYKSLMSQWYSNNNATVISFIQHKTKKAKGKFTGN